MDCKESYPEEEFLRLFHPQEVHILLNLKFLAKMDVEAWPCLAWEHP